MPPTLLLRRLRTTTQWEGQRFILFNCTGSECEEVFVILCLYLKRCLWIKNVPMRELLTGRLIGATSVFASLSLSFFFFKSMKLTRWKSNSACRWGHRVAGVPSSKKSFFFPSFSLGRSPLSRRLFPYYLHRGESPPIPRLICASRSIPVSIPVLVANRDSQGDCSLSVLLFLV